MSVDAPGCDESGIWLLSEAREHLPPEVLATALPAVCVVDVDAHLGHYMSAYWLRAVSGLLDGRRAETRSVGIGTRRLRETRRHARWVAARYLAPNPRPPRWWQPRWDGQFSEQLPEWLHGTVDEVESLLGDLGFVTEWGDAGVATWRVLASDAGEYLDRNMAERRPAQGVTTGAAG